MQKLNLSDLQKVATVLDANNISLYDFKVSISYDTEVAALHFNVFKEGYMNDNVNLFFGSRQTDYLVIIENEEMANESYYKRYKLARMNKASLYELLEKHNRNICNIEHITKLEMIDCLLEIDNQEYYSKHHENESYNNLEYDFIVKGYSQGDCIKVKIVGNVEKWIDKEYLTNIFYNTPISGNIEVFKNGSLIDDFYLYDLADFNEYDSYDKDKLIAMTADYCSDKDYKGLLVTYLNDNLNTTIGYDY